VAEIPLPDTGVLTILARDRYLQLIALLMVLLNLVNTTGNFLLDRFLTAEASRLAGADIAAQQVIIAEFTGDVASIFSLLGMVLQFFFVSRIFRYAGVGVALLILPVIALTGYSMILAVPLLGVIKWVKIFENGTDYSIQNTARQALYLPTSREAKYKAKAAIDTFFVRSGDVLSAGLVYAGTHWVILSVKGFAGVNLALTIVWLAVAAVIARQYKQRTEPIQPQRPAAEVQGAIA
jgi:AAA family ATP:ADP antiporter